MWDCILNCVSEYFLFTYPIGWDEIGVIATVAAVVVALFSNAHANKQLKAALQIQEQSKNVDLFDKRVAILSEIAENNETSELPLRLLFDKTIVDAYTKLRTSVTAKEAADHDMKVYESIMRCQDGEGGYTSPIAELLYFEQQLEEHNYPEDRLEEYIALCKKHEIIHSETGDADDGKVYNYRDLSNIIGKANIDVENKKTAVLELMQSYIKRSISPVNRKGGK